MELKDKIIEAKTLMGEKSAHIIAKDLNIKEWDGQRLRGCCIWHDERTASMIWNKEENYFKSFCCGKVYGILDHYQQKYKLSYIDAVKKIFQETNMEYNFTYNGSTNSNKNTFLNYNFPKQEQNINRIKVEEYLLKRGIGKETLDFAGIKQDKYENIVFEHRDMDNKLLCVKYRPSRAIKKDQNEKMMWWQQGASTCPVLYGLDKIDITMPLLIVEGHIDRLSCIEAGFTNVVSIPHGANDHNWIEFNWDILECLDTIILWGDNDRPGNEFVKNAIDRLDQYKCKIVSPTKDIEDKIVEYYKKFSENLYINKTDANNVLLACGKEIVLYLINNAKEIEDAEIKDLMSYDYYSIQNREKFPTGIKAFDRVMYGHLLKCLTLFTGYTGAGKTTAINQIALKPFLEAKIPIFVFSGEMGGDKLMSWLLDSLASSGHIIEWDNGIDAPKGYSVTLQAIEKMKEFYMGNIKFYDKRGIVTTTQLFNKMEYCRKRYGIKHFFIDNLMSIVTKGGSEEDKWESQIQFIIRLSDFAESKNIGICLVCHPKKPNGSNVQSIYDIAGVSELGNICNRAYWIKKVSDIEKDHQSEIIILKDRETGVSEGRTIKLFYDSKIKRLYSDNEELHKTYSWEQNTKIEYPENIKKRLINIIKNKDTRVPHEIFG